MLLLLYALFLFLLVLHLALYYIFVDYNGADKKATRPELIAPVRLLFQLRVALEQLYCQLSFQDSKPVFGYPNNMILTLVNFMREFLVPTRFTIIGITDRILPPPKKVDF
jgi:hypothetical protein